MDSSVFKQSFTSLAKFQPKQLEAWYTICDPVSKYILYGGAAGGGKSYLLRWAAVGLAIYYASKYNIRNVPIGLFSEDYPTLRDRQITKIAREFPAWLGTLKETKTDGYAFYLADQFGAGVIMLRNLDDPSKYASVEFAAILVEELTKNKEETFEDLRTRLRFPGVQEGKFVASTNPGNVGHGWVKKRWVTRDFPDPELERFAFIPARYSDNEYNPDDYGTQLESITDPQKKKALLNGSWDVFSGQYFEEWNPQDHVIYPFVPKMHNANFVLVGGMDWGRAKPFAFHLTQVYRTPFIDSTFYRAKTFLEVYGTNKTPKEWSFAIQDELARYNLKLDDIAWVRADPSIFAKGNDNSMSIRDQFVDADDRWRCIQPANNDRVAGWSVLHDWLSLAPDGYPYWQIASNCKNLVRTLPDLVHDKNHVEDVDSSGEDHSPDAMRYTFKHLKWLDARVGGFSKNRPIPVNKMGPTFISAEMQGKQQWGVDIDKFK